LGWSSGEGDHAASDLAGTVLGSPRRGAQAASVADAPSVYPEQDLFIQQTKLKNTLRWLVGEEQITHLGMEYYQDDVAPSRPGVPEA
jgi:hypothetical protein